MTTLVSLEVSRREKEKAELKQIQKYEMGLKQIESKEGNYISSTSSSKDKYMIEAMKKVQQSDITFAPTLTDVNGSGMYHLKQRHSHPSTTKTLSGKNKRVVPFKKSVIKTESVMPNVVAAKTNQTKIQHESKELSYDLILEQLGRKRWKSNPSSFFGELREALTVTKGRLL